MDVNPLKKFDNGNLVHQFNYPRSDEFRLKWNDQSDQDEIDHIKLLRPFWSCLK